MCDSVPHRISESQEGHVVRAFLGVPSAKSLTHRSRNGYSAAHAVVAQLVEHELPKLGVEGSNPFRRSEVRSSKLMSFGV